MNSTFIRLWDVLEFMDSIDGQGKPIRFQLKFVTANRSEKTGGEIIELLKSLRVEKNTTLVIATHDAKVAANAAQDAWTTRVLVKKLWANGLPAFTTLWLSEPDYAQHGAGPGSTVARAALRLKLSRGRELPGGHQPQALDQGGKGLVRPG